METKKRKGVDRRKVHTYVADDRRSGVACRRRSQKIAREINEAMRITTFYLR